MLTPLVFLFGPALLIVTFGIALLSKAKKPMARNIGIPALLAILCLHGVVYFMGLGRWEKALVARACAAAGYTPIRISKIDRDGRFSMLRVSRYRAEVIAGGDSADVFFVIGNWIWGALEGAAYQEESTSLKRARLFANFSRKLAPRHLKQEWMA